MKAQIFLCLFTFSTLCFSQSEGFRYGFHFGAGEAKIDKDDLNSQTGKLTINAGLITTYQLSDHIGLMAEFLYTSKGSKASGTQVQCCHSYKYEETYKLQYAEIPVMAKLSVNISDLYIKFFSGPSVNFNIKSTQTRVFQDSTFQKENGFKNKQLSGLNLMEFSLVYGAGFEVELEDNDFVFLEIRNNTALTSFGTINGKNALNNYFTIGVGYLY